MVPCHVAKFATHLKIRHREIHLWMPDLQMRCSKTHLPLVPHICVSELGQHWFRSWLVAYSAPSHYLKNAGLLSTGPSGTNFSDILIKIQDFSFTKMHLIISSAKWQPCPGRWVKDTSTRYWSQQWPPGWHTLSQSRSYDGSPSKYSYSDL